MVNRALQFARSDPAGPVYLCGAREPMEEDIEPYKLDQTYWDPVEPAALSETAVKRISEALVGAKEPLIITGYSGRNHATVPALVKLADTVKGVRVLDAGGSDMCFPADHRAWLVSNRRHYLALVVDRRSNTNFHCPKPSWTLELEYRVPLFLSTSSWDTS